MKKATTITASLLIIGITIFSACDNDGTNNSKLTQEKKSLLDSSSSKAINESIDTLEAKAKLKTIDNMKEAYKGEVTANAKYAAYSKMAEKEGYHPIALLYKAVSIAESVHASNHKEVLLEAGAAIPKVIPSFVVKSTKDNLHDDINDEANEAKIIYPNYLKVAEQANNQQAHTSILYAQETEKKHKIFFEKALGDINSNTMKTMPSVYFVCPICGNTYEASTPSRCDFSLTAKNKFIKITTL